MKFVLGVRTCITVLIAMLMSGAAPAAHAKFRPAMTLQEPVPFQALAWRSSSLLLQYAQAGTQQRQGAETAPPQTEDKPVSKPIVVYEHEQLTIVAENVRLSDILSALHGVMGAQIDLPAGASDERIWARLGPGPARKVLSDLLSNTDLNYVIQGSSTDVHGIEAVMLTARAGASSVGISHDPSGGIDDSRESRVNSGANQAPEQEASASPERTVEPVATPTPPSAAAESQPVAAEAQLPAVSPFPNPTQPLATTTDQMVRQLMNMYQLRKQIQQGQAAPN